MTVLLREPQPVPDPTRPPLPNPEPDPDPAPAARAWRTGAGAYGPAVGPDTIPDPAIIGFDAIARALVGGWRDFLRAPGFGLFFSAFYVAGWFWRRSRGQPGRTGGCFRSSWGFR